MTAGEQLQITLNIRCGHQNIITGAKEGLILNIQKEKLYHFTKQKDLDDFQFETIPNLVLHTRNYYEALKAEHLEKPLEDLPDIGLLEDESKSQATQPPKKTQTPQLEKKAKKRRGRK